VVHNRLIAGGLAVCLIMFTVGVGALVGQGDDDNTVSAGKSGSDEDNLDSTSSTLFGDTTTVVGQPGVTGGSGTTKKGGATLGPPRITQPVIPGAPTLPPCAPSASYRATGITPTEVKIGQILSNVSQLPAQFGPFKDGLQAYVNAINAAGGVCGRKFSVEYRNDQVNPTNTYAQELAGQVFAFVASSSLIDQKDYQGQPPFNPTFSDGGQFVPDIGGLALNYPRSQSPWHAGVIGSISPVLVGGGQYKFYVDRAKAAGTPCTGGGIVYIDPEPSGASKDQATVGEVSLRESWGAGLSNVKLYSVPLLASTTQFQVVVQNMVADNVNCVFTYIDLQSNINLVLAMRSQGVWPPAKCTVLAADCFRNVYMPFASYDQKFIRDGGDGAQMVNTFLPHLPPNEGAAPIKAYLDALKTVPGNAGPSGFSVMGFASGQMFAEALGNCGSAPTRNCVMEYLRNVKDFSAGGLVGPVTPFKTTKVRCGDCGSLNYSGVFAFKHIFNCSISMRVQGNDLVRDGPPGFACDVIHVARGEPA
jgi:ABC-type branched-subunit amino acid transport system substrate-binding protein